MREIRQTDKAMTDKKAIADGRFEVITDNTKKFPDIVHKHKKK